MEWNSIVSENKEMKNDAYGHESTHISLLSHNISLW